MAFIILLFIIAVCCLLLWGLYLLAKEFYKVAKAKGYPQKKYLWLSFWLGIVGYLLVIALPDRGNSNQVSIDDLPDL